MGRRGKEIDDSRVNGEGGFKRFWRKITGAEDEITKENNRLPSHQGGKSIAKNKALNLDGDSAAEVIFEGDHRFDRLMDYSKQVGAAIKSDDEAKLPKGHGFSNAQIHDIFHGNQQAKEKALSENFNMQMKSMYGEYDKNTSNRLSLVSKALEDDHLAKALRMLDDKEADNVAEKIEDGLSNKLKNIKSPKASGNDYNVKPEYTKDMGQKGQSGIVCRHQAGIGAAMLENAGVKAFAFGNKSGGGGALLAGGHEAVYLPSTGNIAEFTAKPASTYQLNIFGNDLNGKGYSGVIYTINANNPSKATYAYDPTQEGVKSEAYGHSVGLDAMSSIVHKQVTNFGSDNMRNYLMSRDDPGQSAPQGMYRPEKFDIHTQGFAIGERLAKIAHERHPEAYRLLTRLQFRDDGQESNELNKPDPVAGQKGKQRDGNSAGR